MRVAAIIPAFNEEKTISQVIKILKKSQLFSEIIVISDGSSDETAPQARKANPDKVIELPFNMGKAKAMEVGVAHTDSEVIFFADADLIGLNVAHVKRIIQPVMQGRAAMSVGLRDKGVFINPLMPYLPLIGGERALLREVFESLPDMLKDGYMIEPALNTYCYLNGLKTQKIFCPNLKMRPAIKKRDLFEASYHYFEVSKDALMGYVLTPYFLLRED